MEQKYIYSFSQIEDKVKALHEINTEAAAAVALSWLGLSRDELKTLRVSDYNSTMRMLHSAGRVVYVREDLIADMLKAICEEAPEYSMGFFITDVNSAYEAAEKQELSPISVLKMRYFYESLRTEYFSKRYCAQLAKAKLIWKSNSPNTKRTHLKNIDRCHCTNTSSICSSFAYTSICYNSQDGFQSRLFYVLTTKKSKTEVLLFCKLFC